METEEAERKAKMSSKMKKKIEKEIAIKRKEEADLARELEAAQAKAQIVPTPTPYDPNESFRIEGG